jgi:ATP-dependent protease ClpP protease subunit
MNTWYNLIENKAAKTTEVQILDEIGRWGVSYKNFIKDIKGVNNDIKLILNTPGGSTFEGFAIFDALTEHKSKGHKIFVKIVGSAISMGSVLTCAASGADSVEVAEHSRLMIHNATGMGWGTAKELESASKLVKAENDKIIKIISDFSGKSLSDTVDEMNNETWYHGQEIIDNGFAGKMIKIDKTKNSWNETEMADKYKYKLNTMEKEEKDENLKEIQSKFKDFSDWFKGVKGKILPDTNKPEPTELENKFSDLEAKFNESEKNLTEEKQKVTDLEAEKVTAKTEMETLKAEWQTKFNKMETAINKFKVTPIVNKTGEPIIDGELTDEEKNLRSDVKKIKNKYKE